MRLRGTWPTGLLALLLAVGAVPLSGSSVDAGTTSYTNSCDVNLRSSPSMTGAILVLLPAGATVAVTGAVTGDSWSVTCGTTQSGSSWYAIASVNGMSVSSLYGVSKAYAATGMFRLANVYLEGVDISKWQGTIDFTKVRAAGKTFVAAKATEGIGYADPTYAKNRTNAIAAGIAFTAYHFARPDLNLTNPTGEADWFVNTMGLTAGMLTPALDLEVAAGTVAQLQTWVGAWLDRVYTRTGVKPMIYVSPSFWRKYLGDTTMFADQGYSILWVAHWGVSNPSVPANNWSNRSWTFWQYDDCGSVPGIGGCVDLDRYNGLDLTPVTVGATFALSGSPASRTVQTGQSGSYTIALARTYFTLPIDMSVSGLPAGAVATIGTGVSGDSTSLQIATSRNGTWTPQGTYTVTVSGTSAGQTASTTVQLTVTENVSRIAGADRYATAAALSRLSYPTVPVPVVYIANGLSSADALAGAAVAGKDNAPLLLVPGTSIPSTVTTELARLKPGRIVILGGPSAVSDGVRVALDAYTAGTVSRIAGADRYATAAALSRLSYPTVPVPVVYIANGLSSADALAGAAVAGKDNAPLLLVPGTSIPSTVTTELARLKPGRIVILGGPSAVSDGVRWALGMYIVH